MESRRVKTPITIDAGGRHNVIAGMMRPCGADIVIRQRRDATARAPQTQDDRRWRSAD